MSTPSPGPLEITLEFARTDDAGDPYAFRRGAQAYLLRSAGGGYAEAALNWSRPFLSLLDRVRLPGRDPADVQQLGEKLRSFLADAGWEAFEGEIQTAVSRRRPVHLTIRSAAAELYALPWELMTLGQSGRPLGAIDRLLIRYEWPRTQTTPASPSPRAEGGRVLLAWSAASGRVPATDHASAIVAAADRGLIPFDPVGDVLPHARAEALESRLRSATAEGRPFTALHLLAHGASAGETFGLAFADADGGVDVVDAARLRDLLAPHLGTLRLVVVAACDGGNAGELGNHLGSVAQSLHRAGVQAVVASRFPLTVQGSNQLSRALYEGLLSRLDPLETAFTDARRALRDGDDLDWASAQLLSRKADGHDTRPFVVRPYPGLHPFDAKTRRFFFGRDPERAELLSDLHALEDTGKPRFVVLVGPSGSGKSSLLRGGVVQDLAAERDEAVDADAAARTAEEARDLLRRADLLRESLDMPGLREATRLLEAAVESAASGAAARSVRLLDLGPGAAGRLDAALGESEGERLLLVADPLDPLLLEADPDERDAVLRRLWALAKTPGGPTVLASLREDHLSACEGVRLDDAGTLLDIVVADEAHRVRVSPLERDRLRDAVAEPARRVGLKVEEGLAERIADDLVDEPGVAVLLQLALDGLWDARTEDGLTSVAYEAAGGIVGILERHADRHLDGLEGPDRRRARRILVRLAGTSSSGARRRLRVDALRPRDVEEAQGTDRVIEELVAARLLVQSDDGSGPRVELAHRGLGRSWSRLQDWLAEDREMLAALDALEGWVEEFRKHGTLLSGDPLGYARQVAREHPNELSVDARNLLDQSEARVLRKRRNKRILVGVAVLALLGFALIQTRNVQTQKRLAGEARAAMKTAQEKEREAAEALAATIQASRLQAAEAALDDPSTAAAIALEIDPKTPGYRGLALTLAAEPLPEVRIDTELLERQVRVGPEGDRAVVWKIGDPHMVLLRLDDPSAPPQPLFADAAGPDEVQGFPFHPWAAGFLGTDSLAISGFVNHPERPNIDTTRIYGLDGEVRSVHPVFPKTFTRDEDGSLAGIGKVGLDDMGPAIVRFDPRGEATYNALGREDGGPRQWVETRRVCADGRVYPRDDGFQWGDEFVPVPRAGREAFVLSGTAADGGMVFQVAPKGDCFVAFVLREGSPLAALDVGCGRPSASHALSGGEHAAIGWDDGRVTIIDGVVPLVRRLHDGPVSVLESSDDGRLLLSGSQDGTIVVATNDGRLLARLRVGAPVSDLQLHSGTNRLVAIDRTGRLFVWDLAPYVDRIPGGEPWWGLGSAPSGEWVGLVRSEPVQIGIVRADGPGRWAVGGEPQSRAYELMQAWHDYFYPWIWPHPASEVRPEWGEILDVGDGRWVRAVSLAVNTGWPYGAGYERVSREDVAVIGEFSASSQVSRNLSVGVDEPLPPQLASFPERGLVAGPGHWGVCGVALISVDTGEVVDCFGAPAQGVAAGGDTIVWTSGDALHVRAVDGEGDGEALPVDGAFDARYGLAATDGAGRIAVGTGRGAVSLVDRRTSSVQEVPVSVGVAKPLRWSPDGELLLIASYGALSLVGPDERGDVGVLATWPVETPDAPAGLPGGVFAADGSVIHAHDRRARRLTLPVGEGGALKEALAQRSSVCLTAAERVRYLRENDDAAKAGVEACAATK